jgi:hypothetical protein
MYIAGFGKDLIPCIDLGQEDPALVNPVGAVWVTTFAKQCSGVRFQVSATEFDLLCRSRFYNALLFTGYEFRN